MESCCYRSRTDRSRTPQFSRGVPSYEVKSAGWVIEVDRTWLGRPRICVDDDVDVFNETQVLWALAMRFQADRDLVIIPNIIGSHLNPTAYGYNRMEKGPMETKLIFDATKPMPPYDFPKEAQAPDEVLEHVDLARDTRPYDPAKDDKIMTGK